MYIIIFLLLIFSCFSLSSKKDNEIINAKLLSESDPTDQEVINYCLNLMKTNSNYKSYARTYLDLFYGTDNAYDKVGSVYFGDLSVTFDEVVSENYYEFKFISNTVTFKKDSIYLINSFTDSRKGDYEELNFYTLFEAAYGLKAEDYFNASTFNCDTFADGDIEYGPLPVSEQNILRKMNQCFNSTFEDNYFEQDGLVLYPKETFTATRKDNPDLSKCYTTYKFYGYDDPKQKKYNYSDFGYFIYELNKVPNELYISFNNPTFLINADNIISFDQIKSQITANDFTDGDITNKITFKENTYLPVNGKIKPGNYSFIAEVVDSSGNVGSKKFNIEVKDITPPQVSVNDINLEYYESIGENELKNKFSVTDNCDEVSDIKIDLIKDTYHEAERYGNFNAKLGTYNVILRYTDKSGNYTDKSFNVIVNDHVKPIITIKEPIISYTKSPLSINDIKDNITAIDEYDGSLAISLENLDNYGAKNEIKEYSFKASAIDIKGNKTEAVFSVSLVDNDIPEINFNTSYLIIVDEYDRLSKEMILELLKSDVDLTNFKVLSIDSEYLSNNNVISGNYEVIITGIDLLTQEEKTINAEIRVPEAKENEIKKIESNSNLKDFISENKIFIYTMASTVIVSFIVLVTILIKNIKKRKKNI